MAALAERAQVAGPRVARVVVEVRGGEHNSGLLEIVVLAMAGQFTSLPRPSRQVSCASSAPCGSAWRFLPC